MKKNEKNGKKLNLPFYHSKTGLYYFFFVFHFLFFFHFFIFYFLFFHFFFHFFIFFSKVHINNIPYCGFTSNSPAGH